MLQNVSTFKPYIKSQNETNYVKYFMSIDNKVISNIINLN